MLPEGVKSNHTRCAVDDCENTAVVRPIVTLVRPRPFPELEIPLPMYLCGDHRDGMPSRSLLTKEFWGRVSLQFRLANQPPPLRDRTRIDWESLR
jgi:hypothetical protein